MKKAGRWEQVNELMELEVTPEEIRAGVLDGKLKKICDAPNIGDFVKVFKFRDTYVALWDCGNGYFEFFSVLSVMDVAVVKWNLWKEKKGEWLCKIKSKKWLRGLLFTSLRL